MAHDVTVPTAVCAECGWLLDAWFLERARECQDAVLSAETWLLAAHCCACVEARCACGGAATRADLTALLDAFGDTPTPPRPLDWWCAVWAYELIHAEHAANEHRRIVCSPDLL